MWPMTINPRRTLEEHNLTEIAGLKFEMDQENKILMPHSLKIIFKGLGVLQESYLGVVHKCIHNLK